MTRPIHPKEQAVGHPWDPTSARHRFGSTASWSLAMNVS
jgi:hypothetical protein